MPADDGAVPRRGAVVPPAGAPTDATEVIGLPELSRLLPLAHGDLDPEQIGELTALKAQIQEHAGLVCGGYKENCLRRRLGVRMRARGVHRYADYARLLGTDPAEYEALLSALTINVSRFFRNRDVWEAVEARVLPDLLARDAPYLNLWSAGTAAGEEAYTLAILAHELRESRPELDPGRFRIIGTDIDPDTLAAARRAQYGALALSEISEEVRTRWFTAGYPARLREEIRTMVRFWELDLIADAYPRMQHLIVCRNVIIYFEREVQEAIFARFREALVPGGFLVLGKVETTVGEAAGSFESVSASARIYRRL